VKVPIWLLQQAVLAMHAECIAAFGGADGVRDAGLLESALARPQHLFRYEKADLCRLAAAYGHGIAKNHPFLDGNKRTAFLATTMFLARNGLTFTASPGHAAGFMLGVADGTLAEAAFAAWLRDHTQRRAKGPKKQVGRPRRGKSKPPE
jgi:death on curing protein